MLEIYCRLSVQSERLEHLQLEIQSQEHKLEDTDSVKRKLAVSCRTCSLIPRLSPQSLGTRLSYLTVSSILLSLAPRSLSLKNMGREPLAVNGVFLNAAQVSNCVQFLFFSVGAEGAECVAIRNQSIAPGGGQQPPQQAGEAL